MCSEPLLIHTWFESPGAISPIHGVGPALENIDLRFLNLHLSMVCVLEHDVGTESLPIHMWFESPGAITPIHSVGPAPAKNG